VEKRQENVTTELAPGQRFHGGEIPEFRWEIGDDACDCVFQRIGDWTNPYLGRTMRVRLCCIWAELYKEWPQFVQEIPASWDQNERRFDIEPMEWNGEADMPLAFWHRHLASLTGMSLPEVREKYKDTAPPKGIPRPVVSHPPSQEPPMSEHEVIGRQLMLIEKLQAEVNTTVGLIHALKKGEVALDQIELHDGGFSVTNLQPLPAEEAVREVA
jgi:hypothetical protein